MLPFFPIALQTPSLTLPAFTAYPYPNPDDANVNDDGKLVHWLSPHTRIVWGGKFTRPGTVHVYASLTLPAGTTADYRLTIGASHNDVAATSAGSDKPVSLDFGDYTIPSAGWTKIVLQGLNRTSADYGSPESLRLVGDPAEGAEFNLKPRRNAASVHLIYPSKADDHIAWFYNEVDAKEDPVDTYYMACGFSRGYFGMQVNSPTERRIIFSVWDSGKEAVDRSKVVADNRVQLIDKGKDVFADSFGNEGTGGHSHLIYDWRTGTRQRFLVHAEPNGDKTVYTAYFWFPETKKWGLIASFSAPHDGKSLYGLYSFVEDFNGDNGNLKRKALYGPAWIRTENGAWVPIEKAKFSFDSTGGKDRFDYDFGVEGDRFFLQNGGFEGSSPAYGTLAERRHSGTAPKVDLDALKRLVHPMPSK